jgi:hypothetical protein
VRLEACSDDAKRNEGGHLSVPCVGLGILSDFIESCKREFAEQGLQISLVRSDGDYDYNVIVAQESSMSGAAGAVVVLDHKGLFVASVVRSGRWSGKGALNASAKELAKKLAILNNSQ